MARAIGDAFIGRDAELDALREAISVLETGRGGARFLVGDPGIGKSALLDRAAALAGERGVTVVRGRAYAGLAFAPVVQALGTWLRGLEAARRAALTRGLSDLSRLFMDLELPDPPALGDPALEKMRLFEAIALLFERHGDDSALLVAIDDLHLADVSTIELLQYLVRRLEDAPVLVLCTARTHGGAPEAREFLAGAELAGAAHVTKVEALDPRTSQVLVARVLGGDVNDELAEFVHARSDGVPLFVVTLIDALVAARGVVKVGGAWRLGPGAHDVVPRTASRLVADISRRLDVPTRRALEHLAVGGSDVALDTLEAVSGLEQAALSRALGELTAHGLVNEGSRSDGTLTYSFSVPLVQEAVYGELSEVERRCAHARFVRSTKDAPAAVRARHVRGAGPDVDDDVDAIGILLSAARDATSRYAHDEAARWYAAALTLLRSEGRRDALPDVLDSLGDAWRGSGESAAAVEAWQEALALSEKSGDLGRSASLRGKISIELGSLGCMDASMAVLREGIAALEPEGSSVALARLYEASFVLAWRLGDTEWVIEKARALSQWEEDDTVAYSLAMARANERLVTGDLAGATSAASHAFERATNAAERMHAARFRLLAAMASGQISDEALADFRALSEEAGVPSLSVPHSIARGLRSLYSGDLTQASSYFEEAALEDRPGQSTRTSAGAGAFLATTLALRGRFDECENVLDSARERVEVHQNDAHLRNSLLMAHATLAIERGDAKRAREVAGEMSSPGDELPLEEHLRAEAWVVGGEPERAVERAERTLGRYSRIEHAVAGAERVLALVDLGRGDTERARERLRSAAEAFERCGMNFFAARARLELGEIDGTPSDDAVATALSALTVFERADAARWQERARAWLRRHGKHTPRTTTSRETRALSDRELEVARLAARGLTNAQIGRELFISPHTVATHMKRILRLVGVSNRPALAAWLRDEGLA